MTLEAILMEIDQLQCDDYGLYLLLFQHFNRQRQDFRSSGGKLKIWGKPPLYIDASYKTKDGEERSSLLLASGWWGIARYFQLFFIYLFFCYFL